MKFNVPHKPNISKTSIAVHDKEQELIDFIAENDNENQGDDEEADLTCDELKRFNEWWKKF